MYDVRGLIVCDPLFCKEHRTFTCTPTRASPLTWMVAGTPKLLRTRPYGWQPRSQGGHAVGQRGILDGSPLQALGATVRSVKAVALPAMPQAQLLSNQVAHEDT